MRYPFLAILVIVPIALIGWMYWVGHVPPPPEPLPAARKLAGDPELLALFQGPLAGAQLKGEIVLYDPQGLFNYIDGAAPIFIERQFRKLAAAELATAEGSDFTCDIYDMSAPAGAESIFTKERSATATPAPGFAQGVSGPMSLVFRQGRYYVKLTAFDARAEAALPLVGQAIAGKIQ
ncbi:MAG: DUF6599 family protein [Myxococcaceae bacterium]